MPAPDDLRPFLRHLEAIQKHDGSLYTPFLIADAFVGLVRDDLCELLHGHKDVFEFGEVIKFLPNGPAENRTKHLAEVSQSIAATGLFNIRGEPYPVLTGWGEEVLATVDRGAYTFFGTYGFGVHVNGLVKCKDGLHLWIAKRAKDRAVAPGKLDNIIGGGLSANHTAYQTLIKEAGEEAGLPPDIAATAIPVGAISYAYDVHNGVKCDTLFLYDLYLPENFTPVNTDGEVESFELLPIAEVARLVRDTDDFKLNVNAVIIDLLIRHGYFAPDMKGYEQLINGLRR